MSNIKRKKNEFADILQKYRYVINNGDIIAGTIIQKESCGFLVNIGTTIAGYLPQEEIKLKSITSIHDQILLVHHTREFFLIAQNSNNQQPILSIKRIEYIRAWKRIKQIYMEDAILNVKIKYPNRGGLVIYLENIQGFIPQSEFSIKFKKNTINNYISCKIINVNDQRNQLILSNKSTLIILSKHNFKLGEILYGKIRQIKSYGLFLDIHGIKALLHISETKYALKKNIETSICTGHILKVKIIHINVKRGQLSVSRRNLK